MKFLVLIDSFKGCHSSKEAGMIIKEVIEKNDKHSAKVLPIADGGEGTVQALADLEGAKLVSAKVKNPLLEDHIAEYLIVNDKLAIMEMSAASGLTLIRGRLAPLKASTRGVGDMIKDALDRGIRSFIIGIGGSATNDAGMGMLKSLGVKFLDAKGECIEEGPIGIKDLVSIDLSNMDKRLKECEFNIACDVDNPLFGKKGASCVYGPQKGASEKEVLMLDKLLEKFHNISLNYLDANANYEGAGAAGGLGYAFLNYLNATLKSGIKLILEMLDVEKEISMADVVITGEGKMDFQTSMGKTPIGVAKLAKKYGKPVLAFCGVCDNDAICVNKEGIDAFFPIINKCMSVENATNRMVAKENLERAVMQVLNVIDLWR